MSKNYSQKRNLITGGAGFIGSHLTDKLMKAGEEVICLDNFSTGSKSNVRDWIGHPNFELIRHDITEPIYLEVDKIWHLACPASPIQYQKNPIKTTKTIFLGTYNMLGLARRTNSKLMLSSTSEVYGNPLVHPQKESYNGNVKTISIRSCYDEGKRLAETLCFDYNRIHNVQVRVVRIFNTYGPRMLPNDGRVVSNFIVQALRKKNINIHGDGSQTRSFCYVDDLIHGMEQFMNSDFIGPLNLGNPNELTIKNLADLILKKIGNDIKIEYIDLPKDDPVRRKPDIQLAKDKLNWNPSINLDEGLDKTIKYFQSKVF